jgi:hypothetical protein
VAHSSYIRQSRFGDWQKVTPKLTVDFLQIGVTLSIWQSHFIRGKIMPLRVSRLVNRFFASMILLFVALCPLFGQGGANEISFHF